MWISRFIFPGLVTALLSTSVWAQLPFKSFLGTGETLVDKQFLMTANGLHAAMQLPNGNLCVFRGLMNTPVNPGMMGTGFGQESVVWCHNKTGGSGPFVTVMQNDGNLCTYRGTPTRYEGAATWCSNKTAPGGKFVVAIQDDGNLCVYPGTVPGGPALWCHNTNVITALPPDPQVGVQEPLPYPGLFTPTLYTRNTAGLGKYVWITIYDLLKTRILISGCVDPYTIRAWTEGSMAYGSFYHIRAEVMTRKGCVGTKVCDTSVQVRPQNFDLAGGGDLHNLWWEIHDSCYWDTYK